MQDESVWVEQVEEGLIAYIQSIVMLENKLGVLVPVPVIIRKPEEALKTDTYPIISLYNISAVRDDNRYNPTSLTVSKDVGKKTLIAEDSAVPFMLHEQIDFWSVYEKQMNQMTRKWLSKNVRDFNLPVVDAAGNKRTCYVLLDAGLSRSDLVSDANRLFHSIVTLRIFVEIDERIQTEKPMITQINIE